MVLPAGVELCGLRGLDNPGPTGSATRGELERQADSASHPLPKRISGDFVLPGDTDVLSCSLCPPLFFLSLGSGLSQPVLLS